jgi:GntR family transcriptional regulator
MADPKCREIANDLQRRIESGELARGDRLPNEMEFRERYDASRNTVRDAIKWLTIRGLVETKAGQGTFVTQLIEPIITTLSEDPETGLAGGEGRAAFAEIIKQRERKRQAHETARQEASGDQAAEPDTRELPEGEPLASVPTIEVKRD